jgi:hypothetical protein
MVDRIRDPHIELLLVSDAGLVQNYTNLLVPSVDISAKSFNIPIPKTSRTPDPGRTSSLSQRACARSVRSSSWERHRPTRYFARRPRRHNGPASISPLWRGILRSSGSPIFAGHTSPQGAQGCRGGAVREVGGGRAVTAGRRGHRRAREKGGRRCGAPGNRLRGSNSHTHRASCERRISLS